MCVIYGVSGQRFVERHCALSRGYSGTLCSVWTGKRRFQRIYGACWIHCLFAWHLLLVYEFPRLSVEDLTTASFIGSYIRIMSEEETDSNSSRYYFGNASTRIQSSFVFSGPIFVILMMMMVTLVVVIVLGNALVILAFKVDKSLRRQCNYYFLNLAISDFLVGKSNLSHLI